jgi:hypothetical protein
VEALQAFVKAFPAAASGPFALMEYGVAAVVVGISIVAKRNAQTKAQRVKTLCNGISEENRRLVIEREYSTVPRAGISAEQWLQDRTRNSVIGSVVAIVGCLIFVAAVIVVTALTRPVAAAVAAPMDPPPNPAVRVADSPEPVPDWQEPIVKAPKNMPKTVGVVQLLNLKQDVLQNGDARFTVAKVMLRNTGDKPLILEKILVNVVKRKIGGPRPYTALLTPISRVLLPITEYELNKDTVFELRDPIQIGGGDAVPVELLFCAGYFEKGHEDGARRDEPVPIRKLDRGNKDFFVHSMVGGLVLYVKLQFEGDNTVVTDLFEVH